jgi:hypothetical protein
MKCFKKGKAFRVRVASLSAQAGSDKHSEPLMSEKTAQEAPQEIAYLPYSYTNTSMDSEM